MDVEKHQEFARRLVQHQHRVFRYVVSLVPNRADAEEIFQQTCLTLWENWEQYDCSLDFVPWACGIAYNQFRNHSRKLETQQLLLDEAVVEQLQQLSMERQQQQPDVRKDALRDCLAELNQDQRAVLESYYSGLQTVEEIAEHRSSTRNAVYKMLRRIRAALRDCIASRLAEETTSRR